MKVEHLFEVFNSNEIFDYRIEYAGMGTFEFNYEGNEYRTRVTADITDISGFVDELINLLDLDINFGDSDGIYELQSDLKKYKMLGDVAFLTYVDGRKIDIDDNYKFPLDIVVKLVNTVTQIIIDLQKAHNINIVSFSSKGTRSKIYDRLFKKHARLANDKYEKFDDGGNSLIISQGTIRKIEMLVDDINQQYEDGEFD